MIQSDIEARIRDSFARQSLMTTLGAQIIAVDPGKVTIIAPILAIARQQHDAGHAGLTFSIGDSAAGYAALTLMPEGTEVMTVEMKINLIAPAKGDRLTAFGKVVKSGRRLTIVSAEVFATQGQEQVLIALLQGTMISVSPA